MKLHFYIGDDDAAERCREASRVGQPIAIGGADSLTGRIKSYAGVVLAVERAPTEAPGARWRITMDAG